MASVFTDTNSAFPRSQSSSNLPTFLSFDFERPRPDIETEDLPRSASYTSLPVLENPAYSIDNEGLQGFSSSLPQEPSGLSDKTDQKAAENGTHNGGRAQDERPRLGRTKSLVARQKSWIQRAVKGSPERKESAGYRTAADAPPLPVIKGSPDKAKSVPESFASYARKTWISSSRSPSPIRRNAFDEDDPAAPGFVRTAKTANSRKSMISPSQPADPISDVTVPRFLRRQPSKKSLQRKPSGLQNGIVKVVDLGSPNTSDSSLPGSLSDKESSTGSTEIPAIPKSSARDKLSTFGKEAPRKKDELWSAFRALESDYQKFQAKSSALRTNVIRATLLPFLKNYAYHPSNKSLRPEDIDRRISIFNKWWIGLLEMLDGHHNQYVSGIDRPVILDAITGIMTRPEWRLAPSHFAPKADKAPHRPLQRPRSSGSLNSGASQFLAESVHHNVRNMFIQNLLSQMAMVVDKMSLRSTPASLVAFCGKAAAYAFFFCPGLADVLVKVWSIPPETIRRVADEFGLVRRSPGINSIDEVVADFPSNLHSLGWKSVKATTAFLRQRQNLPIVASKIPWNGPWTARWCGRDSDLFFVFCKHYHILCEEFLPSDAPIVEKARAPGFALVHAQILTALDATIHRQSSTDAIASALSIVFDDVLAGADASAAALPQPPSSNATRLMAENRLIMLLRDFMTELPLEFSNARLTFAEAFAKTFGAAARKTSQFDHNACFIMCDFMEEALTIYLRFQKSLDLYMEYIDWSFWLSVCRKMLESENTMTEIRLFSFIFKAWNMIAGDERRKEVLCFEWLLSDDTFRKYFLHWCPMVRAYYVRLLCWRACRFDEEASQLDIKIYGRVSDCLKLVWSYYLYQKQGAERGHQIFPSITPCHPAPGRRLLIIRNDNQIPTASLFLGFDGIVQATSGTQETAYKRHSSLAGLVRSNSTDFNIPAEPSANSKKRWSLLGKIMPFNASDPTAHPTPSSSHKHMTPLEQARLATAASRSRPPLQINPQSSSSTSPPESAPSSPVHRPFSFKFSLEWTPPPHQNDSRRNSVNADSPHSRRLSPPRLPAPAHAFLVGKVPGTATEVLAKQPVGAEAKYAGRALAEWALVVKECNNFVERRKAEGVPGLKLMEVPTLGVEGFRKHT